MKIAKTWLFAVALAASAFACGGDDDDDDDTPDAAPTPDASVMPDAEPPIDADTTPDAVPPGEMTLTVIDGKAPLPDVDVVFSNRDGTLISHMKTDANGEATETVPGRAFITIFNVETPGIGTTVYNAYTLGGVMPGDAITIDASQIGGGGGGDDIGTLAGTVDVDWNGEVAGATEYQATEGCETAVEAAPAAGGDPPDTTVELYTGCQIPGGTTWHIVASAFMEAGMFGGDTLAATFVKDVTAAGGVTLPAWNTNFEGHSVMIGNAPKGVLAVLGDGSFTLGGVTYDLEDGDFFFGGTTGTYNVLVPEGFGPDSTTAGTLLFYGAGMSLSGFSSIQASQAGLGSDLSYDLAADSLPGATDGTFVTGTRPSLSWLEAGDMSVADIAQIGLNWDDVNEEHNWLVVTDPGHATPFQLPELPAALADFAPDGATEYTNTNVVYIEADYITDDWDTIRTNGGQINQGPADENFVLRFSVPILEESAPLTELVELNKRILEQVLGR